MRDAGGCAMRVKILDKRYVVLFQTKGLDPAHHAHCEHPKQPQKQILIRPDLEGELLLDRTIHEFLHAADWHKDESWIEECAADLARFLTRLGYKKG
jgi:hypothetical protein